MAVDVIEKDPDAVLPYSWDWATLALPEGETIDTYTVTAVDSGVVIESDQELAGVVSASISGGTPGMRHPVRCRIVTTPSGYEDDWTIYLKILNK
jgi:hypothetical protein